jgi:hypothetical protein
MPMLFWLPLIFMNELFEMVAPTKSAPKPTRPEQPTAP